MLQRPFRFQLNCAFPPSVGRGIKLSIALVIHGCWYIYAVFLLSGALYPDLASTKKDSDIADLFNSVRFTDP